MGHNCVNGKQWKWVNVSVRRKEQLYLSTERLSCVVCKEKKAKLYVKEKKPRCLSREENQVVFQEKRICYI